MKMALSSLEVCGNISEIGGIRPISSGHWLWDMGEEKL